LIQEGGYWYLRTDFWFNARMKALIAALQKPERPFSYAVGVKPGVKIGITARKLFIYKTC
jgi:hypothetical protein